MRYTAARVGDSVEHIKKFEYTMSQLGDTADGALQSLEGLSAKLRESPGGAKGFLTTWGVPKEIINNLVDAKGEVHNLVQALDALFDSPKVKGERPEMRRNIFMGLGISEQTYRAMRGDREKFNKEYDARLTYDPEKAAAGAVAFQQAWRRVLLDIQNIIDNVGSHFDDNFKAKFEDFDKYLQEHHDGIVKGLETIAGFLVRIAEGLAAVIAKFGEWSEKSNPWIESITGLKNGFELLAIAIGATLFTAIGRTIAQLGLLVGGTAWKALVGFLSGLGLIGSAAAAAAMMYPSPIGPEDEASRRRGEAGGRLGEPSGGGVGGWIADKANRVKAALGMGSPAAPSWQAAANAKESIAFWKSKGMTDDAAKMLAANEMRETNFNPGAVGGAGEVGSFQWDASRRAAIKAATGIDVANASHADQLKAAEWELKTKFPDVRAKMQDPNTSDAERAVNLVHNYEKSGNQPADIQKNLANMKAIDKLLAPGGNETNIPLSGGAAGRPDSLTGMQPEFRARLAAMMKDAPAGTSVFLAKWRRADRRH